MTGDRMGVSAVVQQRAERRGGDAGVDEVRVGKIGGDDYRPRRRCARAARGAPAGRASSASVAPRSECVMLSTNERVWWARQGATSDSVAPLERYGAKPLPQFHRHHLDADPRAVDVHDDVVDTGFPPDPRRPARAAAG